MHRSSPPRLLVSLLSVGLIAVRPAGAGVVTWIKQKAATADFMFSVQYGDEGGSGTPLAIRVLERGSGETLQQIPLKDAAPTSAPPNGRTNVVDANFDGHPDIDLYAMDGGAGPNDTHDFDLFESSSRRFRRDEKLSSPTQLAIGPHQAITSAARNGCCDPMSETWRHVGDRLTLVDSWQEALQGDDIVTMTRRLVDGKMRCSVKRRPISAAAPQ